MLVLLRFSTDHKTKRRIEMRNLSILGVVILALSLIVLNAAAGRSAIVGEEGPKLASLLGDEGGESDTDYP